MAKSTRGKGTKAPTQKRKPETPRPRRTKLQGVKDMGPITIEGKFDDGHPFFALEGEPIRELTIVASRRFLWWEVSSQRIKQTVKLQPHTVTQEPDGAITYSVPMKLDGPCEAIPSPWWERTLYAIARIWS